MTLIVSKVTANVTKLTALPSICHLVDKPKKRDRAPRGQKESPEQPPEETPEGRHQNKKATGQRSRLATGTSHTPKPEVPVPDLGHVPVPVRGAQVPGLVVEGAAAQNAPASEESVGSATASLTICWSRIQRPSARASARAERPQPAAKLSTDGIRRLVREHKLLLRQQAPRCCQS